MSYFITISDEQNIKEMEKAEIIQQLNLAFQEINRLEADLKSKDRLIEGILKPLNAKIKPSPPKIVFDIKDDIFELKNNFCDLSIDVSNVIKNVEQNVSIDDSKADAAAAVPFPVKTLSPTAIAAFNFCGIESTPLCSDPTQHQLIVQQAMIDACDRPKREKNVLITFKDENVPFIDQFVQSLIAVCQLKGIAILKQEEFEWVGRNRDMLKIITTSKDAAKKVSECAVEIRNAQENYTAISIRKDYTNAELNLFGELWKEVMERNNQAGSFEWTVKNFRIVRNFYKNKNQWNYRSFGERYYMPQ